jgi:uncharacterized protein YxjI
MSQYVMRKRIISVGGDYNIEDLDRQLVYDVDRKVRFGTTFAIKDRDGRVLVSAKETLLALDGTIVIKREKETLATLRTVGGSRNPKKFHVELTDGSAIEAHGRFDQDDRYTLSRGGQQLVTVAQDEGTIREIYRIDIAANQDEPLLLAIVASITLMVPENGDVQAP